MREKNIASFFKSLDVSGLGEGNVARIIKAGYNSVPSILKMTKNDFLKVEGFKEKTATKIYNSIKEKINSVSLPVLMNATNIFGRGMGESRLVAILNKHPTILTMNISSEDKESLVKNIEGFAKKTANLFVIHIPQFLEFIKETGLQDKLKQSQKKIDKSDPLYGKKILLTGFRDKSLETQIKARGGSIASSASSKVFIVLVPSMDADTSKAEEAREKGLTLMTPDIFTKKYL